MTKIKRLANILFTILLLTGVSFGQNVADVQQLELEDGLLDRVVTKVCRDTFGYFYLFFDHGIQRFDGKNFKNVNSAQLNNTNLSDLSGLTKNHDGGISFLVNDTPYSIAPGKLSVEKSPTNQKAPPNLYIDPEGTFKINDKTYKASQGTIWELKNNEFINLLDDFDRELQCSFIKKDKKGNHVILYNYRPRINEKMLVIRTDGSIQDYSSLLSINNKILDFYSENIDHKWLVTTFNGIFILNLINEGIENFYVFPNISKSEFGNIITDVNTQGNRTIFLKETYGLREINSNGEVELLFPEKPEFFHHNQTMLFDQYQNQFFSFSYNPNGEFEIYNFDIETNQGSIDYFNHRIRELYNLDSLHLIIVGHDIYGEKNENSGAFFKYNKKTKKRTLIADKLPAIRNIEFINKTNEYWLGTQKGVFIYDSNFNFKKTLDLSVPNNKNRIKSEVRNIFEHNNHALVGTYKNGIFIVDLENHEVIKQISEVNGLSDNSIASQILDNDGNIWISTFNGITILDQTYKIKNKFYEYHGLPSREFNTDAASKDEEGNLYFGTLNGLTKINPKKLLSRQSTHGLHFTELEIYNKNRTETFSDLRVTPEIFSDHDSLKVSVNFPDFYKHRFDDWASTLKIDGIPEKNIRINENDIYIDKLARGNHQFTLNSLANPYKEIFSINIKRDYTKISGTIGLILFISTLSYFIFRNRIEKLKLEEQQKSLVKTRMAELELTALRSQMNPHFIFNALGSVQYFIQTEKTEKADSFLTDFAKLMRKILESSKSKFISIKEEIELLELYIGLEKMRFENMFNFELIVDPEIDPDNPLPPMLIQPFVENAINHGLYHLTERTGHLVIKFIHIDDHNMECIIQDNGIGRIASGKLSKPNHKSRGLEIVKDRIKTINSQADIKLEINTEDIYDKEQAYGTKVIIKVKYEGLN